MLAFLSGIEVFNIDMPDGDANFVERTFRLRVKVKY